MYEFIQCFNLCNLTISVSENDIRRLSTKFQGDSLQVALRCSFHNQMTNLCWPSECDFVNIFMGCYCISCSGTKAWNHIDNPRGKPSLKYSITVLLMFNKFLNKSFKERRKAGKKENRDRKERKSNSLNRLFLQKRSKGKCLYLFYQSSHV